MAAGIEPNPGPPAGSEDAATVEALVRELVGGISPKMLTQTVRQVGRVALGGGEPRPGGRGAPRVRRAVRVR